MCAIRLGSGDSRRGPQGGEWGSPWRGWSHPLYNLTGLENNLLGVIWGWERARRRRDRETERRLRVAVGGEVDHHEVGREGPRA